MTLKFWSHFPESKLDLILKVDTLKQASSALGMMFSPQLGRPSQARLRDMHSLPFFCWNCSSVGHSYSAPSENCKNNIPDSYRYYS